MLVSEGFQKQTLHKHYYLFRKLPKRFRSLETHFTLMYRAWGGQFSRRKKRNEIIKWYLKEYCGMEFE